MAGEKKKKAKNLDELLGQLGEEHSKDLDSSFKAWGEFNKDETQNHLYNRIFKPAQTALYEGISAELDKIFEEKGGDDASVHNKEQEIKKAVVAGLKKYFEKTLPSVTKSMDDLGMDENEQYEHLVGAYDEHIGADGKNVIGIRALAPSMARGRKNTVGHVKKFIDQITDKHIGSALGQLSEKYAAHHFSKYNGAHIAGYLKPKLEAKGFEIEDKVSYARGSLDDMLELHKSVLEGKGHKYLKKAERRD